ncbi:MAG TPA: gas vesicle protein GvpG [Mycobacteriales bacterium]
MGLLTGLLTLPLAPVRGVDWLARQVADEADRELCDTSRIQAELRSLVLAADAGLLTEEEFEQAEEQLLDQLEQAEHRAGVDGRLPYRCGTWGDQ